MNVREFSQKYRLSSRDSRIAEKLYGETEREETEWFDALKKDFEIRGERKESPKEKIIRIKAEKKKASKKPQVKNDKTK